MVRTWRWSRSPQPTAPRCCPCSPPSPRSAPGGTTPGRFPWSPLRPHRPPCRRDAPPCCWTPRPRPRRADRSCCRAPCCGPSRRAATGCPRTRTPRWRVPWSGARRGRARAGRVRPARSVLWALALGRDWLPPHEDPELARALERIGQEAAAEVQALTARAGESAEVDLHVQLRPGLTAEQVRAVVDAVTARLGTE